MENSFNNRDFEQFVKQNADQYRMFPSEKVWKNIHHSLHIRRRWYGIGFALLLLTTGAVTWVMLNPAKRVQTTIPAVAQNKTTKQEINSPNVFIAVNKPVKSNNHFISNAENLNNRIFLTEAISNPENNTEDIAAVSLKKIDDRAATSTVISSVLNSKTNTVSVRQPVTSKSVIIADNNEHKNIFPVVAENKATEKSTPDSKINEGKKDIYPMTIESVVNSFIHHKAKKRLSWEVYFSPTISYRKLGENKDFINSAAVTSNSLTYYTAISDINSLVTHKPDIGLQLGFKAGYPVSKSLKILAGLQFNVSKYDIRAYTYSPEVATIALNTGTGSNSVSAFTNYRNFNGNNAGWLRNLYYSASIPVGVDLKLTGSAKTKIGIVATIQPTYILGDRAYLLTTDYKNYVEMPSLTRRWNISGGVEAYAGISTGKIQWKIGPQFRYQMLSSFKNTYPVRENIFDFGLKVGIMLKNR